jgi:3-dehydroquinate synthetase/shikimate kinase
MDVVLVGLPGSGKSAVGRRIAHRHGGTFVDLDQRIEREAGRSIPEIFTTSGETGFRALERAVVEGLGPAEPGLGVDRVVATGGGTVVDPRNRWRLYRGRIPIWLDGRPEVLAQRLRRSPNVRPLVAGRDPIGALRALGRARERFYAGATWVNGVAQPGAVVEAVEAVLAARKGAHTTTLMRADTTLGRIVLGEGIAGSGVAEALEALGARRAILVSEPGAWEAAGGPISAAIEAAGLPVEAVLLPRGEDAKTLASVEAAARELARRRVERGEPLVAIGGGALGDSAGFLAAIWLRGVPLVHVPTTLVAQIDSSIGGKTAVDLPEGKNLLGAFHQPATVVIDIALLRSLPERERRAALGEAVKMAALGDELLLGALEQDGEAIIRGDETALESGALAEVVERTAWAKVEIVTADERETVAGGRMRLNLGHSLGHAFEAAGGYRELLHGEAVGYGLRAALRIGGELGVTPPERAARIERLLDRLGLGLGRLPYPIGAVRDALGADKKHAGGRLHWILPTGTGVEVRSDVPDELVWRVAGGLLAEGVAA